MRVVIASMQKRGEIDDDEVSSERKGRGRKIVASDGRTMSASFFQLTNSVREKKKFGEVLAIVHKGISFSLCVRRTSTIGRSRREREKEKKGERERNSRVRCVLHSKRSNRTRVLNNNESFVHFFFRRIKLEIIRSGLTFLVDIIITIIITFS